jgi:tetratricopeptide (TPR) repeat protein
VTPDGREQRTPAAAGVLRRRFVKALTFAGGLAIACTAVVAGTIMSRQAKPSEVSLDALATSGSATGTPAERRIAAARASIDMHPKRAGAWADLALALARRARETADPAFYREGWTAAERALALEPGHLEARKLQVWILLGQHEFARAVEAAERLNQEVPDEVLVYGFLVDGYTELGRHADAEKAAQWMLDMRPGNVPGLTRAAHLRELFGDHEGAVELLDVAYRRTADAEVEDRAWILTQIAHLSLLTCRAEAAERLLGEALALFPDYHYALAQMADVRQQQGRASDAAEYRVRHVAAAPHPENEFELGVALARAGRAAEAERAWASFEKTARAEMESWDSANVELVYYYANHADRPAEALAIAEREARRRQDVRTLEALAWALHRNGRHDAAAAEMKKVLDVGVSHPVTLYRAAAIAAARGDAARARDFATRSVSMCGTSAVADLAEAVRDASTDRK